MWNEACDVVDLSVGLEIKSNKPTYEQLEKALDKVCEELEELSKEVGHWKTKEEWKKELLK